MQLCVLPVKRERIDANVGERGPISCIYYIFFPPACSILLMATEIWEVIPSVHEVSIASLSSEDYQVSAFSIHPITTDGGVIERAHTNCVKP